MIAVLKLQFRTESQQSLFLLWHAKMFFTKLLSLNQICGVSIVYLSKPLRQFFSDFIHILCLKNKLLLNLIKCNNILFWLVHSFLQLRLTLGSLCVSFSLASGQIYIQVVPLCDCNNNIRKQVYMAFEQGLFNSTSE